MHKAKVSQNISFCLFDDYLELLEEWICILFSNVILVPPPSGQKLAAVPVAGTAVGPLEPDR